MSESVETIPPYTAVTPPQERVFPARTQWVVHLSLFLVTLITTTIAGIFLSLPVLEVTEPRLATPIDYLLYVPTYYLNMVTESLIFAFQNPGVLVQGLIFSTTLLAILMAHEMGHYLACRRYGVSATLPYFIPAPPPFIAGTLGAFIKIKSPIPSRRALLDIGLAGPLAGFLVAIPIAMVGVLKAEPLTEIGANQIVFNDPLMLRLIAFATGTDLTKTTINPYYMAAWIGFLVTSLNLMPVGQLDGGHGTFAVFGEKAHRKIGTLAFVSMVTISVLGFYWYGSPSGFLYTVLLAVMLRVRHPNPQDVEPLGTKRILIAVLTLIVFALSFWPFPITIT